MTDSAAAIASSTPGAATADLRALVADAAHRVGVTPADEPGLEVELSGVGQDERSQAGRRSPEGAGR